MTAASAPRGVAVTELGTFSVSDPCRAPKRLRIVVSTPSLRTNQSFGCSSSNQKCTTSLIQPGGVAIEPAYKSDGGGAIHSLSGEFHTTLPMKGSRKIRPKKAAGAVPAAFSRQD